MHLKYNFLDILNRTGWHSKNKIFLVKFAILISIFRKKFKKKLESHKDVK